jgi:hypothetical protein
MSVSVSFKISLDDLAVEAKMEENEDYYKVIENNAQYSIQHI